MDIREEIIVNDVRVKLQPYSELRHDQLKKIEEEVDKFVEKHPDIRFSEMKRSKKAEFWMKKAKILWDPKPVLNENQEPVKMINSHWDKNDRFFTKEFFEDKGFEHSLLKKSQDFFLMNEVFL